MARVSTYLNFPRSTEAAFLFYKSVFGFTEVRYFDIRGVMTGLTSYALRSPDGSFCIPINEGTEAKSQINEYLEEYNGPGIQHLAFLTDDLLASLAALEGTPIEFLDIDADYFAYADQDDVWEADKLERAVAWLQTVSENVPALYGSRTLLVDARNQHIGYSPLFERPAPA